MKNLIGCILLCFLFIQTTDAQSRKKKKKKNTISIATALNFYPAVETYSLIDNYNTWTNRDLILNFITQNGGTFTIEDGENLFVERRIDNQFPTQQVGAGLSVRVMKPNAVFHELSLTRLSVIKTSIRYNYIYSDSTNTFVRSDFSGFDMKSNTLSFRYEYGRYFGWNKRSKFLFGLSGGVEPSFHRYNFVPRTSAQFPISGTVINLDASLAAIFTFKLAKKLFLDFKPIGFVRFGGFNRLKEENPILTESQRFRVVVEEDFPELNYSLTIQFRVDINEPKKKRR